MKFLCDVHIAIKLVKFLISKNHECIHVNSILEKWDTRDSRKLLMAANWKGHRM